MGALKKVVEIDYKLPLKEKLSQILNTLVSIHQHRYKNPLCVTHSGSWEAEDVVRLVEILPGEPFSLNSDMFHRVLVSVTPRVCTDMLGRCELRCIVYDDTVLNDVTNELMSIGKRYGAKRLVATMART